MHSDLRSRLIDLRLVVVIVAIAVSLGACSGRTHPFSKQKSTLSTRMQKSPPVIKIAKIDGLSSTNSKSLRRQFIHEARKRGISAKTKPGETSTISVNGTLKVVPYGQKTAVAYVWDVIDDKKNRLIRITGEDFSQKKQPTLTATELSPKTIQRIAAHATSSLAAWLGRQGYRVSEISLPPPGGVRNISVLRAEASSINARQAITRTLYQATGAPSSRVAELSTPQPAEPVLAAPQQTGAPGITGSINVIPARQLTTLVVKPVTGVSKKANRELTQAIIRALRTKGVRIIDKPTSSSLKLYGFVKLGPVENRHRIVNINWHLTRANGDKIALIQQKNKIIAASVSKSWGRTADLAARAAAREIARKIPRSTKTSALNLRR